MTNPKVLQEALTLFEANKYSEFLSLLQDTSELPDELQLAKGIAYLRVGELDSSLRVFSALLTKTPDNTEVKLYYSVAGNALLKKNLEAGNDLSTAGRFEEALEVYSQISFDGILVQHLNAKLVMQLCNNKAVCLINLNKAKDALDQFNLLLGSLSLHPANEAVGEGANTQTLPLAEIWLNKAIILKTIGSYDDAVEAFERCIGSPDASVDTIITALCGKSEVLSSLSRFNEAVEAAARGIEQFEQHHRRSQVEESKASTEDGITGGGSVKSCEHCYIARAFALLKLRKSKEALVDLEHAAREWNHGTAQDPSVKKEIAKLNILAYSIIGDENYQRGEYEEAINTYELVFNIYLENNQQTRSIAANIAAVRYNWSIAKLQLNQLQEAIHGLKMVVNENADHFAAQSALGLALLQHAEQQDKANAGDEKSRQEIYLEAVAALKKAHALQKEDVDILHNLGVAQLHAKQPADAAATFRTLLSISPDNANALNGLKVCEEQLQIARESSVSASKSSSASSAASVLARKGSSNENDKKKLPQEEKAPVSSAPPPAANTAPVVSAAGIADLLKEISASGKYYQIDELKAPGPYPPGVNPAHRELYLSTDDFQRLFAVSKEEFTSYPQWKQASKKKSLGLF